MKKTEKTFFVENLTQELKSASSVVLIDYSGLNVKSQQDLKKKLRQVEAKMLVVKNTLFKLAGKAADLDCAVLTDSVLSGQTALIITKDDPLAPLQVLAKFAKEFELPSFKVGLVEGTFQDTSALLTLAELPSKDILTNRMVNLLANPLYEIIGTLKVNMENLISVLKQASKKE